MFDRNRILFIVLTAAGTLASGCAGSGTPKNAMIAGRGDAGPWWMQQTALTPDGMLTLTDNPWWTQAATLNIDEQFVIDVDTAPAGRMLVRREQFLNRSRDVEAIVWIIDDDEDGSIAAGGDTDSDCYVVDYNGDGIVDRMVDYIDNDGDHDPDEMDIRYFVDGQLRQVWCGMDLDDDDLMWDLAGYEYSGNFFASDPSGNSMIYMNKFDPTSSMWIPISECPFAFYDTDGDTFSETVVRVSAVPISYDTGTDPDYANDAGRYRGTWDESMQQMGIVNIRYSFDIDNLSSDATPLHYDFGFNLVGATPYRFAGMDHFNPLRRPPQVTRVVPHGSLRDVANTYEARETGFTWHEQYDDTIAIGDTDTAELDYRWEGVFWIWERRFMGNTGGPGQKWNVRREWSSRPANRRELYYSGVDRRIHLFGAEEGWIQVGHFGGLDALGEIRMLDTDGNGVFDRWEVYDAASPVPLRVTTVLDERTRHILFDDESLHAFYLQQVLPDAMAANEKLMAAMRSLRDFEPPAELAAAIKTGPPNFRRYAQDIAREMQYHDLRRFFTKHAHDAIAAAKMDDLRTLEAGQRDTTINSHTAWKLIRALQQLDIAYGQGDYDAACDALNDIEQLKSAVTP